MIDTECPLCGHKGKVPPKFAGKQIKCKECLTVFDAGGGAGGATSGSAAGTEKITPTSGSATGTQKISATGGSAAGNEILTPTSVSPTAGSKAGNERIKVNGKVEERKPRNTSGDTHHGKMKVMKAAGSQPGTLAKPGARKPAPKLEELPFDDEPVRRRRKRGPSIMPLMFSLFLLVACMIGAFVIYDRMYGTTATESGTEVASATEATATKAETKVEETKKTDAEPKKEVKPPEGFVNVSKGPFRYGDISIRVTSAMVAPVALKGEEPKADAKHFVIKLEIENRGADRVDYQGWGTAEAINQAEPPTMKDSYGKEYKRLTFGAGANVEGMVLAESVQAGKAVTDVLIFEVPAESSPYVQIELSAANLNKPGKVRLEIPKDLYAGSMVAKVDPKNPKIDPAKPPEETVTVKTFRGLLKKSKVAKDQSSFITALGEQGPAAYAAIPDLLPFVKIRNEVLQIEAILALAKIGPVGAKESVPALIGALKDMSFNVRREAAKALGTFGPHAKEALPALIDATKDKSEEVQESAKEALKLIGME